MGTSTRTVTFGAPLALGMLGVAAVAAGLLGRGHALPPAPHPTQAAAPAVGPERAPEEPAAPAVAPTVTMPGTIATYTFSLSGATEQKGAGQLAQRVEGTLRVGTVAAEPALERWEISNLTVTGSKDGQAEETLEQKLGIACAVRRSASGLPAEIFCPRGSQPEDRRRVEFLVALTQHAPPPRAGARSWVAHEVDGTGSYEASYERRADGSLVRRKTLYDSPNARAVALTVVESSGTLALDGGQVERAEARERLDMQQGTVLVTSAARLERSQPPVAGDVDVGLLTAGLRYEFGQASHSSQEESDRAAARELTIHGAIAGVVTAATSDAQSAAARRLGAYLRLHPGDAAAVKASFDEASDPIAVALISSLAEGRSTPAAEVLAGLVGDERRSRAIRTAAVRGLGRPGLPLAVVVPALTAKLADPFVSTTAVLVLGEAIHQGQAQDPEPAETAKRSLLDGYARGGPRRTLYVTALGSAGASELGEPIRALASEKDEDLRAELAWAARRVSGAGVEHAVAAAISSDPSPRVRRRAMEACAQWAAERPCPGLERALAADVDAAVRKQALKTLWLRAHTERERAVLRRRAEWMAVHDADRDARKFASEMAGQLARGSTGGLVSMVLGDPGTKVGPLASGGTNP